jgi:hypothetical protein
MKQGLVVRAGAIVLIALLTAQVAFAEIFNNERSIQRALASNYDTLRQIERTEDGAARWVATKNGLQTTIWLTPNRNDSSQIVSINFFTYWAKPDHVSAKVANEWTGNHRFVRAYVDSDGDVSVDMQVTLIGSSLENFNDWVGIWDMMSASAKEDLG